MSPEMLENLHARKVANWEALNKEIALCIQEKQADIAVMDSNYAVNKANYERQCKPIIAEIDHMHNRRKGMVSYHTAFLMSNGVRLCSSSKRCLLTRTIASRYGF
jgi:hypothetical protein